MKNEEDEDINDWWEEKAFVLLSVSYQVGVFISRSSLYLFRVKDVHILTVLQTINFGIFFSIAYWKWMSIFVQIPLMVWVGLMGGCSYVNCYYIILESKALSRRQKELAVNVAAFFNELGILLAALFAIFISTSVITDG